ncbi:UPF0764 protein C16orf89 homolog isoform X2 [Rhynchophorus ferrugineus]|uniref:UPF0764 protein C16orf89 homolog isoform X2 n=1 Tax=Rhynchophorus ferrugineus TaxID=354439 RepID=UPI003FCCA6F7
MLPTTNCFLFISFSFFLLPSGHFCLDYRTITAVRHGLDTSLDYIEKNLHRVNIDCCLGVAFVRSFMKDCYQNGTHIMDKSTLKIYNKSSQIIEKSRTIFEKDSTNGNDWKFKYLVDEDIWSKEMKYSSKTQLLPLTVAHEKYQLPWKPPNTDICLHEIINATESFPPNPVLCLISKTCWENVLSTKINFGYILTHKLLILQVAKARNCIINEKIFKTQTQEICSTFYSKISEGEERIDDLFDLFLEQTLLCGYEGYIDFIQNEWLYYIIKTQKNNGCFTDVVGDNLKSRIKKSMIYFEDGCNDHSTGLGAAVLGLYYNYIIKNELFDQ